MHSNANLFVAISTILCFYITEDQLLACNHKHKTMENILTSGIKKVIKEKDVPVAVDELYVLLQKRAMYSVKFAMRKYQILLHNEEKQ